jgi:ABC-type Fe3+/spermidine/putrescine transport system ATPase subunit
MGLHLHDIHHAFGPKQVLRGVSLDVAPGEILCLLGPSGDGKTTLLRLVAGLEPLQHGRIALDGVTLAEPGRDMLPEARRLSVGQGMQSELPEALQLTDLEVRLLGGRVRPRGSES